MVYQSRVVHPHGREAACQPLQVRMVSRSVVVSMFGLLAEARASYREMNSRFTISWLSFENPK